MALEQSDFLSTLPQEIKSIAVAFLSGKDAANLRRTFRAWRHRATEGLFNVYYTTGIPNDDYIIHGIFPLRPHRTYRSVVDGLREYP